MQDARYFDDGQEVFVAQRHMRQTNAKFAVWRITAPSADHLGMTMLLWQDYLSLAVSYLFDTARSIRLSAAILSLLARLGMIQLNSDFPQNAEGPATASDGPGARPN
jgi:hypothetical protein